MGIFIDVLGKFKELGEGLDDGDELQKFFAILTKFNMGDEIPNKVKRQYEAFFNYKWTTDTNFAYHHPDFFKKVAYKVSQQLEEKAFSESLHYKFIKRYSRYFDFQKESLFPHIKHSRYSFGRDYDYTNFIMSVLKNLEPF